MNLAPISHQISDNSHTLSLHLVPQQGGESVHETGPLPAIEQDAATGCASCRRSGEKWGLGVLIRMFICILSLGGLLYFYISKQNVITELRLQIPAIQKELREIEQENSRLHFAAQEFESPSHLMELARKPEYRHLKHPLCKDVIKIKTR